jgi:hypothetical protein
MLERESVPDGFGFGEGTNGNLMTGNTGFFQFF